jgi:hypothetical protein
MWILRLNLFLLIANIIPRVIPLLPLHRSCLVPHHVHCFSPPHVLFLRLVSSFLRQKSIQQITNSIFRLERYLASSLLTDQRNHTHQTERHIPHFVCVKRRCKHQHQQQQGQVVISPRILSICWHQDARRLLSVYFSDKRVAPCNTPSRFVQCLSFVRCTCPSWSAPRAPS